MADEKNEMEESSSISVAIDGQTVELSNEINAENAGEITLSNGAEAVKGEKDGDSLILTLSDGQTVALKGFFNGQIKKLTLSLGDGREHSFSSSDSFWNEQSSTSSSIDGDVPFILTNPLIFSNMDLFSDYTPAFRDSSPIIEGRRPIVYMPIDDPDITPPEFSAIIDISEGQTLILDSTMISGTDDRIAAGDIQYTVSNVMFGEFQLVDDGSTVTTFTQAQISSGAIQFVHDDSENIPEFTISASDGINTTGGRTGTINFTFVNDNTPTLDASTITLNEGETINITTANLNASDIDTGTLASDLTFTVAPTNGVFKNGLATVTSFTLQDVLDNNITFTHDDSENIPTFTVSVSDGLNATVASAGTVNFTYVNDNTPTLDAKALTLDEGETITVSTAMLNASDIDTLTTDTELQFTVSNVTQGAFKLNGVDATSFTLDDIKNNLVTFEHNDSETAPTFDIALTDGLFNVAATTGTVNFTHINDNTPTLDANTLSIKEGETVTITTAHLNASDIDTGTADADLTFNMTNVTNGSFQLNNVIATSFTLADVKAGNVTFVHNGAEFGPTFTTSVSDGLNSSTPAASTVTFTNVFDGIDLNNDGNSNARPDEFDIGGGVRILGKNLSRVGYSVSEAGDINADGFDDFIIGAPSDFGGRGESYVLFGSANSITDIDLASHNLNGNGGFKITGKGQTDFSGNSVSAAGDINGDGYDDFLVNAQSGELNQSNVGISYVIFGKENFNNVQLESPSLPLNGNGGIKITGQNFFSQNGEQILNSVSNAGDVNGDGFDDILIGTRVTSSAISGKAYLIFGKSSGFSNISIENLTLADGFSIESTIPNRSTIQLSVSEAGDFNGDGFDDILIGDYNIIGDTNSPDGEVYVLYGKSSGFDNIQLESFRDNTNKIDLGSNGITITGNRFGSQQVMGFSVSGIGDFNGDGFDDIIMGARGETPQNPIRGLAGVTYIVFGGQNVSNLTSNQITNGTNGIRIYGDDYPDNSGTSVSSAGDVNGDGIDDILISAPQANNPGGNYSGDVYVIFGKSTGLTDINLHSNPLNNNDGFRVLGDDFNDRLGGLNLPQGISSAGDLNGDGFDDILIGADRAEPAGRSYSGEVYVIYGRDFSDGANNISITTNGTGTAATENFVGSSGNDTFADISTNDTISAGSGNDSISVTSSDFFTIDGGNGIDTLSLGTGVNLDLTGAANGNKVNEIEVIDLGVANGANSLKLDLDDVLDLPSSRDLGDDTVSGLSSDSATSDLLRINGGAGDQVDFIDFADSGTDVTVDGINYNLHQHTSVTNGRILIQQGITVNNTNTPTLASNSLTLNEGQTVTVTTAMLNATDPDAGTTDLDLVFTVSSVTNGKFQLSGVDATTFNLDDIKNNRVTFIHNGSEFAPSFSVELTDGILSTGSVNGGVDFTNVFDGINLNEDFTGNARPDEFDAGGGFRVLGQNSFDRLGRSVSGIGDFNGDGFDDFIVGADEHDNGINVNNGESYIIFGKANGTNDIDLASNNLNSTDGFKLLGDDTSDLSGNSVSGIGDFNGDGFDDIIIGARNANSGNGKSYVVFGNGVSSNGHIGNSFILNGSNGFTISGTNDIGHFVNGRGDVNGDGFDDLVATDSDKSYIIFGKSSASATVDTSTAMSGNDFWVIDPVEGFNRMEIIRDVNGDGYDDILISAPSAPYINNNSLNGAAFVIFGKNSGFTDIDLQSLADAGGHVQLGSAGVAVRGAFFDGLGTSVSSAGDFNGDGIGDFIVDGGNPAYFAPTGARLTRLVFGSTSLSDINVSATFRDGSNGGFNIFGDDNGDFMGHSLSSAGDVNGDGFDDLLISAPGGDSGGGNYAGEVYVIFGKGSGFTDINLATNPLNNSAGIRILGDDTLDRMGGGISPEGKEAVSGIGDINGDGFDDILIGANRAEPSGRNYSGEAYVIYGRDFSDGANNINITTNGTGTAATENFVGSSGDDTFTNIATSDTVSAGAGNDSVTLSTSDFFTVDGGNGIDSLLLGTGVNLDLTGAANGSKVEEFEHINLGDSNGANLLTLDLQDILDLPSARDIGDDAVSGNSSDAATSDLLRITGGTGDQVDLTDFADSGTDVTVDGVAYDLYSHNSVANGDILIESGLSVI